MIPVVLDSGYIIQVSVYDLLDKTELSDYNSLLAEPHLYVILEEIDKSIPGVMGSEFSEGESPKLNRIVKFKILKGTAPPTRTKKPVSIQTKTLEDVPLTKSKNKPKENKNGS